MSLGIGLGLSLRTATNNSAVSAATPVLLPNVLTHFSLDGASLPYAASSLDPATADYATNWVSSPGTIGTMGVDPTLNATGIQGTCPNFAASNKWIVSSATGTVLPWYFTGAQDWEICFWVNFGSLGSVRGLLWRDTYFNAGSMSYKAQLAQSGANWVINWLVDATNSQSVDVAPAGGTFGTGAWEFVRLGYRGASDQKVFAQVSGGTLVVSAGALSGNPDANAVNFGLGHTSTQSVRIDELLVRNAIMTSDEHVWMYNGGAGRSWAAIQAYTGS